MSARILYGPLRGEDSSVRVVRREVHATWNEGSPIVNVYDVERCERGAGLWLAHLRRDDLDDAIRCAIDAL